MRACAQDRKEPEMKQEKIVRVLTYFYMVPLAVMIIFNTVNSLLRTTYFELYRDMETAKYRWDSPLLVLVSSGVLLVLLYLVWKSGFRQKLGNLWVSVGLAGAISLAFVLMFRCVATCDSESLSQIAIAFMENNYGAFEQGEYLYSYSFQLGMTALLEVIYRLFGIEQFLVFQILNVISIMVIIGLLHKITGLLFEDESIRQMEGVLSFGMLPLYLFATFVYGDIIGWGLGVGAIYFVILYFKKDKGRDVLIASILLMFGTLVKSNINILVVAAAIALVLHAFQNKQYKAILLAAMLVLISQVGVRAVNGIYANRAGLDAYPPGIPKIAWVAMSMQEADEGGYACGWYNAYNWHVYRVNDYDRDATTAACMENLKESLSNFMEDQGYALEFFYKKFTSQWNAPTFQAMITNEWSTRHAAPLSSFDEFLIYGFGRDILYAVMNVYHFLIFLLASAYFLIGKKKWSLPKAYFVLNIFGGFLFHMLWEAQSRYILGYFVLMLPLAAAGLCAVFEKVGAKGGKNAEV